MHRPSIFESFFMGGFECSTHRRHDGRRLDLLDATGHDRLAGADYRRMARHGLRTVRDGARWHRIELAPDRYDWSSFLPMLDGARLAQVQVVWDLCHYGWPDGVDVFRPHFVERFAAFARALARVVRDTGDAVPWYCPINEISYLAWAGGDKALMNPLARGRSLELKHQLVRASIAAIDAIREVDSRARFVNIDPLIHIAARDESECEEAAALNRVQYDASLLLSGELWPGLGGEAKYLDVVGLNYYPANQWYLDGTMVPRGHPAYVAPRELFAQTWRRFGRPMWLAETAAEGDHRVGWMRHVFDEVLASLNDGVPIEGVCWYPVLDYPGWDDDRRCLSGLYSQPDDAGERQLDRSLADELAWQQRHFADCWTQSRTSPPTAEVRGSLAISP